MTRLLALLAAAGGRGVNGHPTLLDAFCGAGGAARGYADAGFDVTGVDIKPQPRYPYRFVQGDALEYIREHGHEYDAIAASPPCQGYSRATAWRGSRDSHPRLIAETRAALRATGRPYAIENVQEARGHLVNPVLLCGSMFGLRVRRHRYFEVLPVAPILTPSCQHRAADYAHDHGGKQTESAYREAMGVGWMTVAESREAIPPAYSRLIGAYLLGAVRNRWPLDAESAVPA